MKKKWYTIFRHREEKAKRVHLMSRKLDDPKFQLGDVIPCASSAAVTGISIALQGEYDTMLMICNTEKTVKGESRFHMSSSYQSAQTFCAVFTYSRNHVFG